MHLTTQRRMAGFVRSLSAGTICGNFSQIVAELVPVGSRLRRLFLEIGGTPQIKRWLNAYVSIFNGPMIIELWRKPMHSFVAWIDLNGIAVANRERHDGR